MKTLKNVYTFTVKQRKIFAVVLALAMTISHVPAAQAAGSVVQLDQPMFGLTVPASTDSAPAVAPTVQEVLLNVCQTNGFGEDCAKTLLGIMWNESSNRSTIIGDHGAARGYFQIHYKLHNITTDCAEDLVCSANWTIKYMQAHSYPKYVTYAIQCHNSCGVNNGYAAKAIRNSKLLWDKPLEVTQAKPIELQPVELAVK